MNKEVNEDREHILDSLDLCLSEIENLRHTLGTLISWLPMTLGAENTSYLLNKLQIKEE